MIQRCLCLCYSKSYLLWIICRSLTKREAFVRFFNAMIIIAFIKLTVIIHKKNMFFTLLKKKKISMRFIMLENNTIDVWYISQSLFLIIRIFLNEISINLPCVWAMNIEHLQQNFNFIFILIFWRIIISWFCCAQFIIS